MKYAVATMDITREMFYFCGSGADIDLIRKGEVFEVSRYDYTSCILFCDRPYIKMEYLREITEKQFCDAIDKGKQPGPYVEVEKSSIDKCVEELIEKRYDADVLSKRATKEILTKHWPKEIT